MACIGPHLLSKLLLRTSRWPPRFLAAAAWICGARVTIAGDPPSPHTLLVSNHVSWLDILILAGATGCAFVSKDALGHGLIHWLADQNTTLYIKRSHRKGARDQAEAIAAALGHDQPLALFPEGTTGPGGHLLPFRSTLLEAAAVAPRAVAVQPVALDYGAAAPEIGWHGESGRDNVLRVLGRRGTLPVTVHLLPALPHPGDRKALAHAAREAIGVALAASSSPRTGL
ncbi:lysophospholipid acyltransferase family protein [Sphingomonas sp.]|uniref:lysophospholipid acyltransferase family protein n=1 Tax=Sphingomonas sp. TaxID=28214 RepID=UPI00286DDEC2|nr:lysophospholipid acyltransferase family protein [Sphingomonas sp.]